MRGTEVTMVLNNWRLIVHVQMLQVNSPESWVSCGLQGPEEAASLPGEPHSEHTAPFAVDVPPQCLLARC